MIGRSVLVVDDHEVVRAGLRSLLSRTDWVSRCVGAGNGKEAVELAHRYSPHVAVVDLCVGDESGLDICAELLREIPGIRVILMSGAGRVMPAVARAAGASGFVQKDWPAETLTEAVRMACHGRQVFAKRAEEKAAVDSLTARERAVLQHLAQGLSNPEVASRLHLSRHTVKQHTCAVYRKLGVRNRAEAASRAQRLGLAT